MTILLLTQVFPPRTGGSGRWLWELYRRLTMVNVHVATAQMAGAETFDERAPLRISRLPLDFSTWGLIQRGGGLQYWRRLGELRALIREIRPDAIHCGKSLPEGLLAAALKTLTGIPFSVYAHGEELTLASGSRELKILTGFVLRAATRVIANSVHTKRLLETNWRIRAAKISVMHPGVDTSAFVPSLPDPAVRARLGWTDRRVILTVGTLQKRKGQDMMIRALPAIRAQCPDVLYSMMGQEWERAYLDALVAELGVADCVQFRGVPSDHELVEGYQQCDVFALPNRQVGSDIEGFGIALIEAQACGRPVIAGQSGGAPETVLEGRSGEVVSCESPDTLAAAAISLLSDPGRREAMGRSGRHWVTERFDWSVLVPQARLLFGLASPL